MKGRERKGEREKEEVTKVRMGNKWEVEEGGERKRWVVREDKGRGGVLER